MRLVYCPCPDAEVAAALAEKLLAEKLVACVNILPAMQSLYVDAGVLQRSSEVAILLKTSAAQAERLLDRLNELHPYEIPAILLLEAEANAAFANWVKDQLASS